MFFAVFAVLTILPGAIPLSLMERLESTLRAQDTVVLSTDIVIDDGAVGSDSRTTLEKPNVHYFDDGSRTDCDRKCGFLTVLDGKCYKFYENYGCAWEAQRNCHALGGCLTYLRDGQENSKLLELMDNSYPRGTYMGVYYNETSAMKSFVDDSDVDDLVCLRTFVEQSDIGGTCLYYKDKKLYRSNCQRLLGYVCEIV